MDSRVEGSEAEGTRMGSSLRRCFPCSSCWDNILKRKKASKGKEPMTGAREIQSESLQLVVENDDPQEIASREVTPYMNPVSMEAGPSQPKFVSQAELNAEFLLTLRAMRETIEQKDKMIEQKDKLIVEFVREKRCKPRPPTPFTGVGKMAKVKDFLMDTELYFETEGASEEEKVQVAVTYLKDQASEWWQIFRKENPEQVVGMTWDKFKEAVTQRFTPEQEIRDTTRFTPENQEIRDTTQRDFIVTHNDHEADSRRVGREEASASSGHQSKLSWENIERISDGLYRFYEPAEPLSANLDIFLFHALECEGAHVQDAHVSSWKSSSERGEIWPQKWLSEDFPFSRIISLSYDCCTKQTDERGRMDMYLITENLLQEIVWARKEHDCYRPMIFVGHGFGGIVMKQLCEFAHNRKKDPVGGRDASMFLDSIRGFLFYSTPHLGVEGLKPPSEKDGPLLHWMYALNKDLARLHEAFWKLKQLEQYRWIIYTVAGQDSTLGGPGLRLPEGSSRYGDNYITVTSSHFNVCRPSDKTSNEYLHLHALIQDVLGRVELEKEQYMSLPEVVVGFDGLIAEVLEKHLRTHAFVGVCGMGGVGKTTLAKLIFNKACVKFEFTCFAEEIKGLTGPKSEMKRRVWEHMRRRGVPVRKADQDHGDEWFRVKGRSLLVIFDDVDSYQHTELLREIASANGCVESRFILTSRNYQVLREVSADNIIRLDHLGNDDATKLLTAYAFPKEQEPSESLREIVQEVIDGCEGLPLTLEILGKHLRYQPSELWTEIPGVLRTCTKDIADLEQRLWARLQLSYDGLPGNEVKNMFLDIASFFILNNELGMGWNPFAADDAVMAWSSIYGSVHSRLKTLVDRSLVTVRSHEVDGVIHTEFYMHEHLRRMGQSIAREKGRSLDLSRIRSSAEPASEDLYPYDEEIVFQGCKEELGKIVAHRIMISRKSTVVSGQSCSFCMMHELWPKLSAIQFMDLRIEDNSGCEQCSSRRVHLPSNLVLLQLELPCELALSVEAGGNSDGDLDGTLSLSTCTSLVKLELSSCKNLGELSRLQQLRVLMIRWCQGTGKWPTSLGELRRLERLELLGIDEPFELPISFGHLTALQHLQISKCKVRSVPVSFTNLTNLQFLEMDEIVGRQAISVGSFPELRVFKIKCWAIADLTKVFRGSTALKSLTLELEEAVPDIFGHLENLREFRLTCHGLENNLVESWGRMTSLEYLLLRDWTSGLNVMLDLRSGRSLKINLEGRQVAPPGIFEPLPVFLTRVEDFVLKCEHGSTTVLARNMINLKQLVITVHGQQPVQDIFGHLRDLRKFRLECSGVENSLVESLGNMTNLEDLTIELQGQQAVRDIFGRLRNLRRFRLVCSGMENDLAESWAKLTSLEYLLLSSKDPTSELRIMLDLRLRSLEISLKGQPAVPGIFEPLSVFFTKVEDVVLECEHESTTTLVRNMINLKHLAVTVTHGQQPVQDIFGCLRNLRKFRLECSDVENSLGQSLGNMTNLEDLVIVVQGQQTVGDTFGSLQRLRNFRLKCNGMENSLVESLGNMTTLEDLDIEIQGQQNVRGIFGHLLKLRKVRLVCNGVENNLVESLGNMINLDDLTIEVQGQQVVGDTFGHLKNLRRFRLVCNGVENNLMRSLEKLTCLEVLHVNSKEGSKELEIRYGESSGWPDFYRCAIWVEFQSGWNSLKIRLKGQQPESSSLDPLPVVLRKANALHLECEHGTQTAIVRNMTHLESFNIEVKGPGVVPDVFGHLKNLREFSLTCSGLVNNLVESWGKLSNLEYLLLSSKDQTSELKVTLDLRFDRRSLKMSLKGQLAPPVIFEPLPMFLTKVEDFVLECEHESTTTLARNMISLKHFAVTVQGRQPVQSIFGCLPNLRKFTLQCNGVENSLVESLRNMIHLESFKIEVKGAAAVPDVFGGLRKLRVLIWECHAVEDSLEASLGALSSLERLDLTCRTMEQFPHVFGCFSTLEDLRICCPALRALPMTVGNFIRLRTFTISDTGLQSLPDSVYELPQLEKLSFLRCNDLTTLPESLGQLSSLVTLEVRRCQNFETLPESVGNLSCLRWLDLQYSGLHFLPDSLTNLSELRSVDISGCSNLKLSLATETLPLERSNFLRY